MAGARWLWTDRALGDFSDADGPAVPPGVPPRPWTWLRQVHGAGVVTVDVPGARAGAAADAAVTATPGCPLVVRSADCAPVVLHGPGGLAVVHAGWRGLAGGVVAAAARALADLGAPAHRAEVGPCIRSGCYEFGAGDLARLARRWGSGVRARTRSGRPSLDLLAAVRAECAAVGIDAVTDSGSCTACDPRWFSHRARGDDARLATIAWLEQ